MSFSASVLSDLASVPNFRALKANEQKKDLVSRLIC